MPKACKMHKHAHTCAALEAGAIFRAQTEAYHYFSFETIEDLALLLREHVASRQFDAIVALERGGNYLATMLSHFARVPIAYARYNRRSATVETAFLPPEAERVLLVEDIAGSGITLHSVKTHLESIGLEVEVLCLAKDEKSRIDPDLRVDIGKARYLFPWERLAHDLGSDPLRTQEDDADLPWVRAFDLDGVFLPDVDAALYESDLERALSIRHTSPAAHKRPPLWRDQGTIITARPEQDRGPTQRWLEAHGIACGRLVMRPSLSISHLDFKISACKALRVTEYVESDPRLAQGMANAMPWCVLWHFDMHTNTLTRVRPCGEKAFVSEKDLMLGPGPSAADELLMRLAA